MLSKIARITAVFVALVGVIAPSQPALAAPVLVEESANLGASNTSRQMVVSSEGDIFVLYEKGGNYIVESSTDGGASFSNPSTVTADTGPAEIAISRSGVLYVTWVDGTSIYQSRSTDSAGSWETPVQVTDSATFGFVDDGVHTAIDREYVYVITTSGETLYTSADSGDVWRESTISDSSWVFADVTVDPLTGALFPFVDRPQVSWFFSTDRGLSFSEEVATTGSISYSTSAISVSPSQKYLLMAGANPNLLKIDLLAGTDELLVDVISSLENSQTRSLAADAMGNVVASGVLSGGEVAFEISTDFAETFGDPTIVDTSLSGGDFSSMTINPTNGDILVMWSKGGDIYFETFAGLLPGYDLRLDVTALDFDDAGVKDIVLENTSGVSDISLSDISLSNSIFAVSDDCPATLSPGDTCTISVTASDEGNAILTIRASGGIERFIPIAFGVSSATVELPNSEEEPQVAAPYTGPIVNPVSAPAPQGATLTLTGSNLIGVTRVTIDGKDALVKVLSDTEIQITVPAGLSGTYDLVVVADNGTVTIQQGIEVAPATQSSGAGTKRIGDSFRIYYFDPVGKGKVQFFLNGKEIAWVDATSDSDPKLRSTMKDGLEVTYLVREVDLEDGKNVIEVYVDGERVKRVAYTLSK